MDLPQKAFIHHPEPWDVRFIMYGCTLFDIFWTVEQKHPATAMIEQKSQDNFLHNSN